MEEKDKKINSDELNVYLANALLEADEYLKPVSIDWLGLYVKLRKRWRFLVSFSFVFACVGVAVALMIPKQFTVTVTLAPEIQGRSTATSSLSSLASMLGMGSLSIGGSSDALSLVLYPDIIRSSPFLTGLFSVEVFPLASDSSVSLLDYMTEKKKNSWLSFLAFAKSENENQKTSPVKRFTPEERYAMGELTKGITATLDNKTGVTTIAVTMEDPQIATQLADTVCLRLQRYITDYRTQKAKSDLDYYTRLSEDARTKMIKAQQAYAQSVDFDRSVILQSVRAEKDRLQNEAQLASQIYQQMETQKEAAKAKYQELKPVFAVLQPAVYPIYPSSTSRKMVVFIFLFLGICMASAWVLFGEQEWKKICHASSEA